MFDEPGRRAAVIIQGLSGEHLYGFLPGNDHTAAISHAVATHHAWTAPDYCGRVTKRGIEVFDSLDALFNGQPGLVISWREVLDIVKQGCSGGLRESYEAAYDRWCEWAREDGYKIVSAKRPSDEEIESRYARWSEAADGIHSTTAAVIQAACARQPVQPTLDLGL